MKTIEERARQASYDELDRLSPAFEEGYIKGATEQKEIDNEQLCEMILDNQNAIIDKACEWLKENVDKYLYNRGGFEEYIPTCGDTLFNDFINAMKGE